MHRKNPSAERFLTFSVLLLECTKRSLNPADIGIVLAMPLVLDFREPSQLILGHRALVRRRRWCKQTSVFNSSTYPVRKAKQECACSEIEAAMLPTSVVSEVGISMELKGALHHSLSLKAL